jgi:AcrR family transcriptional regulator
MERETYHHGHLRAELLSHARLLLDEGGPEAVTLRETARRAGVSATATYRHFRDKASLLAALATEGFVQFSESLIASAQGERPYAGMGRAYVQFALDRPGLFRLMFSPLFRSRATYPDMEAAAAKAFGLLQGAAVSMAWTPGLPPAPALSLWAEAHGLAHLMLDDVFPADKREEILAAIFEPRDT